MQRLFGPFVGSGGAVGLLILRLVAGTAMVMHGWPKIQHATSWMGPGAPVPGLFQFLSAFSEFFGGLAFIVGLLTPIAALGLAINMLVAIFMAHVSHGDPFVAKPGSHKEGYESALGYFAIATVLMLVGPGRLSLDALLFGRRAAVIPSKQTTI